MTVEEKLMIRPPERIRRAGHVRALREHTWQHRFRELFAALHLEAAAR